MEALRASYGSESESESDDSSPESSSSGVQREAPHHNISEAAEPPSDGLPPPPLDLLDLPNVPGDFSPSIQVNRVRSFPHVEGNYALHVFIPVLIPSASRKQLASFVKRVASRVPSLYAVDVDIPLGDLCKDVQKFEKVVLGRELHISLGRTVPIRVHQIDSIMAMLHQKFQSQRQYWMEFDRWEVFVNDDQTRSFLSLEITGRGLSEISKQIQIVDDVYRLHGLPEFYKNPRPHISLVWSSGDISYFLKQAIEENERYDVGSPQKHIFMSRFSGIECKVGKKSYRICKFSDQ